MFDRSQFRQGLDVYDRDSNKIGNISDVGPNYFHISTGFLGLGQNLYIPFSMVDRVNDQGVYLSASKNELSSRDLSKPPVATAAGTASTRESTMAGPMPAATQTDAAGDTITPEEARGHNLCDVNGKQIGSIAGVGTNYFHVVTGLLGLGQDLYVPIDEVDHCNRSCCYLNITSDEAHARGWTNRPAGMAESTERTTEVERPAATERAAAVGRTAGPAPEAPRGAYRIPLREEEIEVHRHREQVGEVIVSKDIVEEQRTINVPVSHEEVHIERHPFTGPAEDLGPITEPNESQTIRVPVYEERIDVEKRPHVAEEIVVSPEETTRQERVTETVRREVPRVRTTGEADEYLEGEETIEGKPAAERTADETDRDRKVRRVGE